MAEVVEVVRLSRSGRNKGANKVGPLYKQTKKYLLGQIDSGTLFAGKEIPALRQIAGTLDVSLQVALMAVRELCEEGWLEQSSNGRYAVIKDIKRLFLQNKKLKIGFAARGSDRIGIGIYQSIANWFQRITKEANVSIDYLLEFHRDSLEIPDGGYDALIVADWEPENFRRFTRGPVVGLDTWEDVNMDFVVKTDHFKGGELAARHLREKGYQNVIYWDASDARAPALKGLAYRRIGFEKGWVDGGGHLGEIKVIKELLWDDRYRAAAIKYSKEADSFFVFSDEHTLRIWNVLDEIGVKVPDDIGIVSFDGSYEALSHKPPITTIKQHCLLLIGSQTETKKSMVKKRSI
jgi:DNA-binding transcriptional regulator YhcF (GntR family)